MVGIVVVGHEHHASPLGTGGCGILATYEVGCSRTVIGDSGLACLGALRGDEDNTTSSTCTIDRCGSVLQHGDALDVVGVQLVQLPCIGINAVDEDEGVAAVNGDTATNADLRILGRTRRGASDGHARNGTLQGCTHVTRGTSLQHFVAFYHGDGTSQSGFLLSTITYHNDVLQQMGVFGKRDVVRTVLTDNDGLRDEAHVGNGESGFLRLHLKFVTTIQVGDDARSGALFPNGSSNNGFSLGIADDTRHFDLCRSGS